MATQFFDFENLVLYHSFQSLDLTEEKSDPLDFIVKSSTLSPLSTFKLFLSIPESLKRMREAAENIPEIWDGLSDQKKQNLYSIAQGHKLPKAKGQEKKLSFLSVFFAFLALHLRGKSLSECSKDLELLSETINNSVRLLWRAENFATGKYDCQSIYLSNEDRDLIFSELRTPSSLPSNLKLDFAEFKQKSEVN
jgi:hypothetical protein